MTTHFDEEDEGLDADRPLDDPLTVILRPSSSTYLGPPPGRYESIRRGAGRRRLLRAAVGAGATCAVIVLATLPFRLAGHDSPTTPTVPLAPPAASSGPTASPTPSASTAPTPSVRPGSPEASRDPSRASTPTTEPSMAPTTSVTPLPASRTAAPTATAGQTRTP
ncbi:hypothetical protein ABZT04_15745 [Streptomyces sp. NPDC005492]|uniref:hypothetical protein n=1 Tax=Streptomyces sp. NPDC005492 TaxID=3156883 RepID=UPI0033B8B0AC